MFGAVGNRPLIRHWAALAITGVSASEWPSKVAERLNWYQKRGTRTIGQGAEAAFFATLQQLVDLWIDSGRDKLMEEPNKRGIVWRSPLSREVYDFVRSNSVPVIEPNGDFGHKLSVPLRQKGSLTAQSRDNAIFVFLQLLGSPHRTRLFRCDGCRFYIVRSRTPREKILRGTFCVNCKNMPKASGIRMKATEDKRTPILVGFAADLWPKWNPKKHRLPRSKWVADMMQDSLPEWRPSLSGNWVTRHAKEIEAEVERRRHATG